jgi:predicted secreted hydrolase
MRTRSALLALAIAAAAGCGKTPQPPPPAESAPEPTFLAAGEETSKAFKKVLAPRAFRFPRDHGAHPEYRTEWWYFTGNLQAPNGRHYGFELTMFRYALAAKRPDRPSAWATNQVWMAHLAVTDADGGEFIAEERFARPSLGLAGARADPFKVWVGPWSASGVGRGIPPLELHAEGERIGLGLELTGPARMLLQGDRGMDRKGPEPGNASYYYSLPRLHVEGRLRIGDREESVSGLAWMDREWSSSTLSADVAGWDWFGLQLADGRDLMFYRLRRNDGTTSPFSSGTLLEKDGERKTLSSQDVRLQVLETWTSPKSGATYPVAWRLEIPEEALSVRVEPYLNDQELRLSVRYWEGAVKVSAGQDGVDVAGSGYLELTGY